MDYQRVKHEFDLACGGVIVGVTKETYEYEPTTVNVECDEETKGSFNGIWPEDHVIFTLKTDDEAPAVDINLPAKQFLELLEAMKTAYDEGSWGDHGDQTFHNKVRLVLGLPEEN